MTDKPIMIDGVDVSGCEYLYTDKYNDKCCSASIGGDALCKPSEMICFKYVEILRQQLARKTQECEELKKANIHIDNNRMVKSNKLKKIEEYCRKQNLKADYTACEILQIIDEVE